MENLNIRIQLILRENIKCKKIILIKQNTTFNQLINIASQKFNKKILFIATLDKIKYTSELLSDDIELICSPHNSEYNIENDDYLDKIKNISNVFIKLYAKDTYVPTDAIKQMHDLSYLPDVKYIIGMPDLHQGKYPVGCAVITQNTIYPMLIGSDIGCGMSFIKTDLLINKLSDKQLVKLSKQIVIGNFDSMNDDDKSYHFEKYFANTININGTIINPIDKFSNLENIDEFQDLINKYITSMGTIGAGNHFVEMQKVDKIYSEELATKYNIDDNNYYLTIHSGSRGLGEEILSLYIDNKINIDQYINLHNYGVEWAKHNRNAIGNQFLNFLNTNGTNILDITHNYVEDVVHDFKKYKIHRKGVAPSYPDSPIIIPGSRGSRTYLVLPLKTDITNGFSVSHGAGRKISRNKAANGMNEKSLADKEYCCKGDHDITNIVICEDAKLFCEEAPFAYKDINTVIDDLVHYGLIQVIASFKPVITYKCRSNEHK